MRQFQIPSVVTVSSTCLVQRWRGHYFLRLPPPGSDSKILRTGLELSIRRTWPSHRRRCILIRFTKSMSSYLSYSFWFHHIRHSPLSQRVLYNLRRIFLSKTPNACSSEDVSVQVSAPFNKTNIRFTPNLIFKIIC